MTRMTAQSAMEFARRLGYQAHCTEDRLYVSQSGKVLGSTLIDLEAPMPSVSEFSFMRILHGFEP